MEEHQLLLTVTQACRALQLSRSHVYLLMGSGELPSLTIGRTRRLRVEDLKRWVESRTPAPEIERGQ